MRIACLGWGSLIWSPRELPLTTKTWNSDGPELPVEFARKSKDGRVTLVLVENYSEVQTLWAPLNVSSMEEAKSALAVREGISASNIQYSIGYVENRSNSQHGKCADNIRQWANSKDLEGVVWTNLKFGMDQNRDKMPSSADVLAHFEKLSREQRATAEEYVRKTPAQVATPYRSVFESKLGWYADPE